ncbi:MAG: translation elongation factor Ts [Epsilonproteobacteria bacterium]|nr:translation elongation factor Ts [Campylobacterota bacterium]|tara:strand:- start:772 stop:1368 length:597 start_codon:yes stop_codon:yes gene_type:complete
MAKVSLKDIQTLRTMTGLGMLDCKKALEESEGNVEKAVEILRKRGVALAGKRAGKETAEGIVYAYIHPGDQTGVLVEINCETDFVARTPAIKEFAKDVAMHIAAIKPRYISPDEVEQSFLDKEREIAIAQLKEQGKPDNMIEKIVEGKMKKIYNEVCLLKQPFVKDDKQTVEEVIQALSAKTGENVKIKRFAKFEIGE